MMMYETKNTHVVCISAEKSKTSARGAVYDCNKVEFEKQNNSFFYRGWNTSYDYNFIIWCV